MASRLQAGGGNPRVLIALLLALLLPLLAAEPAPLRSLEDADSDSESDPDLRPGAAEHSSSLSEGDDSGDPAVQVEATKRSWIAELTANVDRATEAADLIEEIRARTSGSGLRSLRAACRAMCPKCICGIILMPSLPAAPAQPRPKSPKKAAHKSPHATKATEKPTVVKTTKPPHVKESVKKAKKWLNSDNLESQLPDFLLDEDGADNAYKREVSDHDPLSQSRGLGNIGIE